MSSTPIREVFRVLEADGLLVHIPHKGVCVAEISPDKAEEIAQVSDSHHRVQDSRRLPDVKQLRLLTPAGRGNMVLPRGMS